MKTYIVRFTDGTTIKIKAADFRPEIDPAGEFARYWFHRGATVNRSDWTNIVAALPANLVQYVVEEGYLE